VQQETSYCSNTTPPHRRTLLGKPAAAIGNGFTNVGCDGPLLLLPRLVGDVDHDLVPEGHAELL